jgi:integrase
LEFGNVYCVQCKKRVIPRNEMQKYASCQYCGHPVMYIRFTYMGKPYALFEDRSGAKYTYASAVEDLTQINLDITKREFDPSKWVPERRDALRFDAQAERWLERKYRQMEKGSIALGTYNNLDTYYRVHWCSLYEKDVREIKLIDLQDLYDRMKGGTKTRKNAMDGLRQFFRHLEKFEIINKIPRWPELDPVIQKERFVMEIEDQEAELAKIPECHRDIFEFMMETGLRPAEACALKDIDVHPKMKDRILVRRTYSDYYQLRETTKGKHEDWLTLSDRATELIWRNIGKSEFIFTNQDGTGYKPNHPYKIWRKYCDKSFDLYEGTRHSYCTQLVESGANELQAQRMMRHRDRRSTGKYYHPSAKQMKQLANRARGKIIPFQKAGDK